MLKLNFRYVLGALFLLFTRCLLGFNLCISEELKTTELPVVKLEEQYKHIGSGMDYSCAIKQNDSISCWGGKGDEIYLKGKPVEGRFSQLSVAWSSCAIRTDGKLICWGPRLYKIPEGKYSRVSVGWSNHTCAIKSNRELACWLRGPWDDRPDLTNTPSGTFKDVTAGWEHSCALRTDNTLVCWGNNNEGQADAPKGKYSQIVSGMEHNCAIRVDKTLSCWGKNEVGQSFSPDGTFTSISAGRFHNCAIRTNGSTVCWGVNHYGESIAPDSAFKQVSAGSMHSCGIRTDGSIMCWGNKEITQVMPSVKKVDSSHTPSIDDVPLSIFNKPPAQSPVFDGADLLKADSRNKVKNISIQLSKQKNISLYVVTLKALSNYQSEGIDIQKFSQKLMDSWGIGVNKHQYDMLLLVAVDDRITRIHLGRGWSHQHDQAIENIIQSKIIPEFKQGQFGEGIVKGIQAMDSMARELSKQKSASVKSKPAKPSLYISTGPALVANTVKAGMAHICAIKLNASLVCWGDNFRGQNNQPKGSFIKVSNGMFHSCAIKDDATLVCWGDNSAGQSSAPEGNFIQVSAGGSHSCAINSSGTVECWGKGQDDNIPDGTFTDISAGTNHSCAIKSDNTIVCWGDNSHGQLDAPNGSFVQLSAGSDSCAINTDGALICWGTSIATLGTAVKARSTDKGEWQEGPPEGIFTQVSVGTDRICAIQTDGTLKCWGRMMGKARPPATTFSHISVGAAVACGLKTDGITACWGHPAAFVKEE